METIYEPAPLPSSALCKTHPIVEQFETAFVDSVRKRELFQDLAPMLWHSIGTIAALLQVPKLLLHRIFSNARFSIWIDGKLELVVDPYQILERIIIIPADVTSNGQVMDTNRG